MKCKESIKELTLLQYKVSSGKTFHKQIVLAKKLNL